MASKCRKQPRVGSRKERAEARYKNEQLYFREQEQRKANKKQMQPKVTDGAAKYFVTLPAKIVCIGCIIYCIVDIIREVIK